MFPRGPVRAASRLTLAVALLYAMVVLAASFEHHDLSCELKTPQHCTACVSTGLSADQVSAFNPASTQLGDAGSAVLSDVRAESFLVCVDRTGRSPPAAPLPLVS